MIFRGHMHCAESFFGDSDLLGGNWNDRFSGITFVLNLSHKFPGRGKFHVPQRCEFMAIYMFLCPIPANIILCCYAYLTSWEGPTSVWSSSKLFIISSDISIVSRYLFKNELINLLSANYVIH